jgi:hypothetical protein
MSQLSYETLQLELHEIQGDIFGPVDFRKIGYNETHSEFALADMGKAATRITTILPKQCIKPVVKSLMQSITFLGIQN